MKNVEVFYKTTGCSDCAVVWRSGCPVCKRIATTWTHEDGRFVKSYSVSRRVKRLLSKTKGSVAIISNSIEVEKEEKEISIDNFFVSSEGNFDEINEIPENYYSIFKSKGSEYFRDKSGDYVIRKSDHWGKGIRQCNWYLKGFPRINCSSWFNKYGVRIGIIKISELKSIKK